jgi:hypothetical protein
MPYAKNPVCYIGELGPFQRVNRDMPNCGPRLSIVTHEGKPIARLGDVAGTEPGRFLAPHGLAVDSRGDIYVGEVSYTAWSELYPKTPLPGFVRSLQKLVKVG